MATVKFGSFGPYPANVNTGVDGTIMVQAPEVELPLGVDVTKDVEVDDGESTYSLVVRTANTTRDASAASISSVSLEGRKRRKRKSARGFPWAHETSRFY